MVDHLKKLNETIITNRLYNVFMVDFEKMKKKYPRAIIGVQLLWMTIVSTILCYFLIYLFRISGIPKQVLVDVFTYPPNIFPQPYNNFGLLFIPVGMFLVIWANYTLLFIGKIGLRDREPMQKPSSLVMVGP